MSDQKLITDLIELVTEVTGVEIDERTNLIENDIVDSFGMLAIISHLEDNLNIEIDPELTSSDNFMSVCAIADWGRELARAAARKTDTNSSAT